MARQTNSAFADAFQKGFGLAGNVADRELKKKQIADANEQARLDREFEVKKENNLQEYRAEDLGIKKQTQKDTHELAVLNAGIKNIEAQTASTKANTANLKAEQLLDPNSVESRLKETEIAEKQSTIDKRKQETDKLQMQQKRLSAAVNVSNLYDYVNNANGMYSTEQLAEIEKMYQANKGAGMFNLGTVAADIHQQSGQIIGTFFQDMANGVDVELTPKVARAFTTALGIDSSAAVGRRIDETFVNAPDHLKNGNYVVRSQGLHSGKAVTNMVTTNGQQSPQSSLTGEVWVEVENVNDPNDVQFYLAPLSESRSVKSSESLNLSLDDVAQASAATSHFLQNVGSAIKPAVKQARIKAKYGDDSGDNGVEKFEQAVAKILESNRKAIQNGANVSSLFGVDEEFAKLTGEQQLSEAEMAKMKNNIEERLLFGVQSIPTQTRVKEFLDTAKTSLMSQTVPMPTGQTRNGKQVMKNVTLGQVIKSEQWTDKLTVNLNGYFDVDQNGQAFLKDEQAFIAEMKRLGWYD